MPKRMREKKIDISEGDYGEAIWVVLLKGTADEAGRKNSKVRRNDELAEQTKIFPEKRKKRDSRCAAK